MSEMNSKLRNLNNWLIANKLSLNTTKIGFMLIGSRQRLQLHNKHHINIQIKEKNFTKMSVLLRSLGVFMKFLRRYPLGKVPSKDLGHLYPLSRLYVQDLTCLLIYINIDFLLVEIVTSCASKNRNCFRRQKHLFSNENIQTNYLNLLCSLIVCVLFKT